MKLKDFTFGLVSFVILVSCFTQYHWVVTSVGLLGILFWSILDALSDYIKSKTVKMDNQHQQLIEQIESLQSSVSHIQMAAGFRNLKGNKENQ